MTLLCIIEGQNTEEDHQTPIARQCVVYTITFFTCLKLQTYNVKNFWGSMLRVLCILEHIHGLHPYCRCRKF